MRVAFFGDGTLDLCRKRRDGSIIWRRELFERLEEDGHEPLYLAPERHSADAELFFRERVVGWDWRGEVDALIFESRRPFFAPSEGKLDTNAYFQQGRLLRDWFLGKLGTPKLFAVDFDLATRSAFGIGGRKAEYLSISWCREALPEMPEILDKLRDQLTCLVPYDPAESPMERKRDGNYEVVKFTWGYPESIEVEPLPFGERSWDLFYPGSDYDRRASFERYYVAAGRASWTVGVGGEWNDQNTGGKSAPDHLRGQRFKHRVISETANNVTFLNDGHLLSQADLGTEMQQTCAVVQIVKPEYAKLGYETMRPAEAAAAGALVFIDTEIKSPGGDVPHDWFRVPSFESVRDKLASVRGREEKGVEMWRAFLRERGTIRDRARQLVELVSC